MLQGRTFLLSGAIALLPTSIASAQVPDEGTFCFVQGSGVWGGRTVPMELRSSLFPLDGRFEPRDQIALWADNEPAAVFHWSGDEVRSATAVEWTATADNNPGLTLRVRYVFGEQPRRIELTLDDWRNHGLRFAGTCQR
jgi:hypothetical protein